MQAEWKKFSVCGYTEDNKLIAHGYARTEWDARAKQERIDRYAFVVRTEIEKNF